MDFFFFFFVHVFFPLAGHLNEQRCCCHFHIFRGKCSTLKVQRKQKPNIEKKKKKKLLSTTLCDDLDFSIVPLQPRCEASRGPDLLLSPLAKVKICGAEVWSSEVEVKLIEGHGGEVHSLTCRGDSPRLVLAIFRDVTLGTSQEQPPRGGSRGSIRSAESQHNYSTPS